MQTASVTLVPEPNTPPIRHPIQVRSSGAHPLPSPQNSDGCGVGGGRWEHHVEWVYSLRLGLAGPSTTG